MLQRSLHQSALLFVALTSAAGQSATHATQPVIRSTITYTNSRYGFRFTLPASWKGFTILGARTWSGTLLNPAGTDTVEQVRGPALAIRSPLWAKADPHEDIPIFIFTRAQWSLIEKDRLATGAAPIPPGELGRNAKYVFALPARYNFDYSTGWEEVEKIIDTKPLRPF